MKLLFQDFLKIQNLSLIFILKTKKKKSHFNKIMELITKNIPVQLHIVTPNLCKIKPELYLTLKENEKNEQLLSFTSIFFSTFS